MERLRSAAAELERFLAELHELSEDDDGLARGRERALLVAE
jgi:hypothetical protein